MSKNFELLQRVGRTRGQSHERHVELDTEMMGGTRLILANPPTAPAISKHKPISTNKLMREELVKLAQRLFLLPGAFKSIVFSGIDQDNGCDRVCAQVGEILDNQAPRSICLVDANFPRPSLHEYFDVSNDGGLTDAVLQSGPVTDYARRLRGANLWLVPAGTIGSEWPTLVNSDRMRVRIQELCDLYDHVLIAAPPIAMYVDALHLGKLVDGMVLVLQANTTRRETARKVKQEMEAASVRLLGAVLNERTFPIPESIYSRL